jgi:hypothetical protein
VSKYTNAERALVKSIVGYLTIKRVPESVNINVGKLWYGIIQTITLLKLIMTTYEFIICAMVFIVTVIHFSIPLSP